MKKITTFCLLLFSSLAVGELQFKPFIYEFLNKPIDEWLVFCQQQKIQFKDLDFKYSLFTEADKSNLKDVESVLTHVELDGILLPILPSKGSLLTEIQSYDDPVAEVLKVETSNYYLYLEKSSRTIEYDLWSTGKTTNLREIELYKRLSRDFYPNGWDVLTLIFDSHELTPDDLSCTEPMIESDMKSLYLLDTKLGINDEIFNLNNRGLRGTLTKPTLNNGTGINILASRGDTIYSITYIFNNNQQSSYQSILATVLNSSIPLINDNSENELSKVAMALKQYD